MPRLALALLLIAAGCGGGDDASERAHGSRREVPSSAKEPARVRRSRHRDLPEATVVTFDDLFDTCDQVVENRPLKIVRLRVVGPHGDPVDDVTCGRVGSTSDPLPAIECVDGAFPVDVSLGHVVLLVFAPGFTVELVDVKAEPGDVEVRLATAIRVRGRCVDEEGRPVGGASVVGSSTSEFSPSFTTRADGEFDATFGMAGQCWLRIECGWLVPAVVTTPRWSSSTWDAGDVVLRRGAQMRGVLTDAKGRPISQELIAASLEADGLWQRWTRTDANGRFEFSGLDLLKYTLRTANHGAGGGPGHPVGEAWAGDLDVRAELTPAR